VTSFFREEFGEPIARLEVIQAEYSIGERYAWHLGKVVRTYIFGAGFEAMVKGMI
jgi:hypothetical protein